MGLGAGVSPPVLACHLVNAGRGHGARAVLPTPPWWGDSRERNERERERERERKRKQVTSPSLHAPIHWAI